MAGPIATVRFADGSHLEIRKAVVGREYSQEVRKGWNWNPLRPAPQPGHSEETRGNTKVQIMHSDNFREMTIKPASDALMIAFTGENAAREPFDWGTNPPPLEFAVWAGAQGQWRVCESFATSSLRNQLDQVFLSSIFSRKDSIIRIRVTRIGQSPIEISIPNPSPTVEQKWATESLPASKAFSGGVLQLKGDEWKIDKRSGYWATVITAATERNSEWFTYRLETISDASGNYLSSGPLFDIVPHKEMKGLDHLVPNGEGWAIQLPPNNGPWRAQIGVGRSKYFPSKLKDTVPIAEGTFPNSDGLLTLAPASEVKALGVATVSARILSQLHGSAQIEFDVAIAGTAPQDLLSDEQTGVWQIYVNGDVVAAQVHRTKSQTMKSNQNIRGQWTYRWSGPFIPGTPFVLAAPRVMRETVEFTFTPPPFEGPKR